MLEATPSVNPAPVPSRPALSISPDGIQSLDSLLCSWGLGDRQVKMFSAWVVTAAVEHRSDCQLVGEAMQLRPHGNVVGINGMHELRDKLEQRYADLGQELHAEQLAKTCIERCGNLEDICNAVYVLSVMRTFAKATGVDPLRHHLDTERQLTHDYLLACLRLVTPFATPMMVKKLCAAALDTAQPRRLRN